MPINGPAGESTRSAALLADAFEDVRYALRGMRRNPGFTAVALASLALGIGANTAVYSLVDAVLLKSVPVSHPEQLEFLKRNGDTDERRRFSYPSFERFRTAAGSGVPMSAMSSIVPFSVVRPGAQAEIVRGQLVSGEWFSMLGLQPVAGRLIAPSDNDKPGAHPVVVLNHGFWIRRFGGDPNAVGTSIGINGVPCSIIGVAPPRFSGMTIGDTPDVWMPVMMQSELRFAGNASVIDADGRQPWIPQNGVRWLSLLLRLPEGVNRTAVMDRLSAAFHREMQELASHETDARSRADLLRTTLQMESGARGQSPLRREFATPLWVLMAAVAAILLIACANLANLLLARGRARRKEMAIRLAIGAGRGRLIRQLLTETVLLALAGGALGVLCAAWASQALLRLASSGSTPLQVPLAIDYRVLAFAAAVSLLTGLIFGLAPALRATRVDAGPELKAQARVTGSAADRGASRYWLGKALVGLQVALSLVLVVGAILFVRTLRNLANVDPGFDRETVFTARIELRIAGYREQDLPSLYQRLLARLETVPGIRSSALSLYSLASGSARLSSVFVPGRMPSSSEESETQENHVTAHYFQTVGFTILRGRNFGPQDTAASPKVVIVNETFARRFFPDENPLGRRYSYGPQDKDLYEIVGVVRNARINDLKQEIPAMAYYPLVQRETEYIRSIDVRAPGDPKAVAAALRAAIAEVDPNIPVRDVVTLGEQVNRTLTAEKLVAKLTSVLGVLAVVLACIGLFGVMSYTVARRRGELAIRMALGSSQKRVVWLVLAESLVVVGTGAAAGLALSFALLRIVNKLLYGLSATDPVTMLAATFLLIAVGAVAGWIPAWRASRVDPMVALRYE